MIKVPNQMVSDKADRTELANFGNANLDSSNFIGAEKVHNQATTTNITLTNGRIFYCTGSDITLPNAVDGVTITLIIASSSITWNGPIRWNCGKVPTLTSNHDLVSFIGYNGYWYGG